MLPIDRILRQTKKHEKYNILCVAPTHERYESNLCATGHNFYCLLSNGQGLKQSWNTKHAPIPSNYQILPKVEGDNLLNKMIMSLPSYVDFDFVFSQQKFGQFQVVQQLSLALGLPIISLEHTTVQPNWSVQQIEQFKQMKGAANVFISEFNRDTWRWNGEYCEVIRHGVDTVLFRPGTMVRDNTIMVCANDYRNRDWCLGFGLFQEATKDLPVKILGDTPNLSKAPDSVEELIHHYQTSSIFLNTAPHSPIPSVLLEAMACGCAVVSLNACNCPYYITHGVNGFLANDAKEMRIYLKMLLEDEKLRHKFGNAARKTIEEKCDMGRFCKEWNGVFERVSKL